MISTAQLTVGVADDPSASIPPAMPLATRRLLARRRRLNARFRSWAQIAAVSGVCVTVLVLGLFSFLGR